jgi:hypothetical protein
MTRLEQITKAGYDVEVVWECDFDMDILPKHPELMSHTLLQQTPLKTRDALYGSRTEAMCVCKEVEQDVETIQYCDVMSLYPYVCKYGKFPLGHPTIHAGDDCRDIDAMLQKEGIIKCCVMPLRKLPSHPSLQL